MKNENKNINNFFEVPDGYFDELYMKVKNKINIKEEKKSSFNWYFYKIPTVRYVLIFVSFIFLYFIFVPNSGNDELSQNVVYSYVSDNIDDFDEELIAEYIETEEITEEEIIDYLEDEESFEIY